MQAKASAEEWSGPLGTREGEQKAETLRGKERKKQEGWKTGSVKGGERKKRRTQGGRESSKERSCTTPKPPLSDADGRGHGILLHSLHEVLHADHSTSSAFPKATP